MSSTLSTIVYNIVVLHQDYATSQWSQYGAKTLLEQLVIASSRENNPALLDFVYVSHDVPRSCFELPKQ